MGRLERIGSESAQLVVVGPARPEPRAVLQENYIFRMHSRLELFDAPGVNDRRTMDAEKNLGIQGLFQCVHRYVEQMVGPSAVQLDVVLGGLRPVHVLYFDEDGLASRSDSQALQVAAGRDDRFKQADDLPSCFVGRVQLEALLSPSQRLRKA